MRKIVAISIGVIVWGLNSAVAQKYNVKTYTVNDGLPSSQVYDVVPDKKGYVWFATAYGLVRYDGYEFKVYGQKEGLKDELIYDIFLDASDQLWVSTDKGGVGVLVEDSIRYSANYAPIDSLLINLITQAPDGSMWFGTNGNGVYRWENSDFTHLTVNEGLPNSQIWDIQFMPEGETWITTNEGIAVYKKEEGGITNTWTQNDGLSGNITYQTFLASDGTIWVPTNKGVSLIKNGQVSTIEEINGISLGYIFNISEGDDGVIWIGTERSGLYWYDPDTQKFTHVTKKNGLSSNFIYRIVKDHNGNVWVATDGNGITLFKDKRFLFYDITTDVGTNSITALYLEEDGVIWYGSDIGLGRMENGKFETFSLPKEIFQDGDTIWDIERLPNGNLVMLTYTYWLIEFDGEKFFRSPMNQPLMENTITDVLVSDGDILIATGSGLAQFKNGKMELQKLHDDYWKNAVTFLFKDADGYLWLGTEDGLARQTEKGFNFYTDENGFQGSSVNEITQDDRGNIWVGTNEGIAVLAPYTMGSDSMYVKQVELEEIYLPETISLLFDGMGGLWQGTNGGLNYFDVKNWYATDTMTELHFALQEYGTGLEFNGSASLMDLEGNLWFGSEGKGLIKYDMLDQYGNMNESAPTTFIRKIYANGELIFDQNKDDAGFMEVILPYNKNNLRFEFSAINFEDPERVLYRYRLEGFDTEWSSNTRNRVVTYTNLDPGNYRFSAMAKAPLSEWGAPTLSLNFSVDQPFWQKWWFILIAVVAFISLLIQYLGAYINYVEKKKLKVLVDEQTQDLKTALRDREILIKEIHHRVKNNMAVVSGMLQLQSDRMEEGEAKLAIENSKLRIQSMSSIHEKLYQNEDLAHVNIQDFVNDLVESISASLKGNNQHIEVEQDIEVKELDLNKAVPCGLLLNELICNSYEHAFPNKKSGTVKVLFKEYGDSYKLAVGDDGVGIPNHILNKDRASLGLTLIESLTHQIDGKIKYKNGKGTTIEITFPR